MESLIERISAYNIFNNIIPGAVFCYFFNFYFSINLGGEGTVYNLCLFYFWGVFVSRIGSLFIERISIKLRFVRYAPYGDYLRASRADGDIKIFLEVNNMLRTFSSVFLCLTFTFVLSFISEIYDVKWFELPKSSIVGVVTSIFLFLIMMFAYRKQTSYIVKRVENQIS
ncbi:Uncharacterised protein [Salmonella enterica subsp. indica]|uniref:Uncharacterized protein n=1 Tax=Salmonella enterica subsp. indica TaxID=59207 RepID=A0A379XNP2_SALER|nr:hypothetical protein [Salmonella enterica]EBP3213065.1 hypothetical protein [Salmonella enterica subsp. arizonae]EDN7234014.1 hypothetical protein [Salmonella enterica subsp. enterica]ECF5886494.1 hypothetical protein [Salmonella enterica subsp. indica]EEJ0018650.1 hypothetical protein [Salmonella enterica subsp. enterica]EHN2303685.1 hypothetical protein [Salmonella enterica]